MSKYLWLVRHSESQGNLERRIQGWADFPLTRLGRRQAARTAERMAQEEGIAEIVSSPLARAAQTAQILGAVSALPVRFDDRLREYNFGPLNGLTRDEIAARYPGVAAAWKANEFWEPLPDEEGEPAFEARVRAAMDDIVVRMAEETAVVVVMHGGAMNACLRSWLGIEGRGWRMFAFDNASISMMQLQARDKPSGNNIYNYRVILLNDVSHLGDDLLGKRPTWFSAKRAPRRPGD